MALKKKESMRPPSAARRDVEFPDNAPDITEARRHSRGGAVFSGHPTPLSTAVSVDAADDDVAAADDVFVCTLKSEYFFVLRLFKIATPCRTESAAGRIFIL